MSERYSRQDPVIDYERLKNIKVAVVGIGAIGSVVADLLSRVGVGTIYLFDYDTVELHNIAGQRFKEEDLGKPKVKIIEQELKKVNSEICILGENTKIVTPAQLPKDLNYIFSCVDNFTGRKVLLDYQKKINPHVIIFDGGLSTPTVGTNQMYLKGGKKITEFYPTFYEEMEKEKKTTCTGELIPSLVTTSTIVGALRVHQFIQHLTDGREYDQLMNVSLGRKAIIDYF